VYRTNQQNIQKILKMKKYSENPGYNKYMGILDNLENAWDDNFEFESKPMKDVDNLGIDKKWATEIFSETVCKNCSCSTNEEEFVQDFIDFDQ
jgi:hypothetical protein